MGVRADEEPRTDRRIKQGALYSDQSPTPVWPLEASGTSYAAPHVAGAAGLLRSVVPSLPANGHWLKALVLLMGDGYDAPSVTAGKEAGTSEVFGTGKLKVHRPNALPAPAQFMIDDYELEELEEIVVPSPAGGLPTNVNVWKWAVHIYHPDMNEMPWVLTEVRDGCDGNALVAGDYQFGPVKYLSLTNPLLQAGDCLQMRIYGMSVPPGGVEVYSAAYYTSNDPNDH